MKKIISSILIVLFITSSFAFFNTFGFKAKASSETDIYSETNTYNVSNIQKNIEISGYVDKQYLISYNMSSKINRAIASSPTVTVFTHG